MRRLALVGGGHAHVFLLHALARAPIPGVEVVLVTPYARHHYSGMVPGYLQGTYREEELVFDLVALARHARVRLVLEEARRLGGEERVVETATERIPFDAASLDVGSAPVGVETPGVRDHALSVRPMTRAAALRERVDALAAERESVAVCVVGAGAAGFEVALAIERRFRELGRRVTVTMVDAAAEILPGYDERARRHARRILRGRGIALRLGLAVAEVASGHARLADGSRLDADLVVWLTGAAPGPFLGASTVTKSARGWLLVDDTLRAIGGAPIWGAGDCVELASAPWVQKAGVYPVREAPFLERNLRAFFAGAAPALFRPQRGYLSLMNTADGRALLRWRGIVRHTRWAWRLKDRIDRAFMRRFQP